MVKVTKRVLLSVCIADALTNLIGQWLSGILVGKLISGVIILADDSGDEEVSTTSSYYNAILLYNLSFHQTAVLTIVSLFVNSILDAIMDNVASFRAACSGREMRRAILKEGIVHSSNDLAFMASTLIINVKTIEDFQSRWEPLWYFNHARLLICVILTFLFTWYGGLIAIVMLLALHVIRITFDKFREDVDVKIDKNSEVVRQRFLDVLRNAVKIRMMSTIEKETNELDLLEKSIDTYRYKNFSLCFGRDILIVLCPWLVTPLLTLVAWPILRSMEPSEAIQNGTAIIVTIIILEELHKSIIYIKMLQDRVDEMQKAEKSINKFLTQNDNNICCNNEASKRNAYDNAEIASTASSKDKELSNYTKHDNFTSTPDVEKHSGSGIWLENLSLTYPGRQKPVLLEYNKYFCHGKVHGLQGESGCGKSTTVRVIANLIQPDSGSVQIGGSVKVAYVSQDQTLFTRTIRENVTYGANSPITDKEIWNALELARIDKLVRSLPDGLNSNITPSEVSGGQLQRLNLAHLFCASKDADLVILDECLSAVDEENRNILIQYLGNYFLKEKTAIIVTHHSEFLTICDELHHMNEIDDIILPI